jgi:hypothetical protein
VSDVQVVLLTTLLTWLVATLFVHFAAKLVMGGSRFLQALLAVMVGSLLAGLVDLGGRSADWPGPLIAVLALAAFALGLAVMYRASWFKGALLGVVAWILWAVVRYVAGRIVG